MKILESAENYLEAILILKKEKGNVRAIDIVKYLDFSKPSVSVAMKQLETNGYITRDEDGHISLTDDGKGIAESIYERHTILSQMFIKLGVSEDTAREDACKIEHYISEETFDCIKKHWNGL
ncbi:MAG: metal-dependent transcriptional regulator [Bacillota bacterium]|nr:metal-dependent transcriptional regulator [Bacillota bacterium]